MSVVNLPRFSKGEVLKAEDLNRLIEHIERALAITVDGDSGLEMVDSAAGKRIRATLPPGGAYAITTSTITAKVTATKTLGKGTATLQVTSYVGSTGVGTYDTGVETVTVYNGNATTIASGRLVMVKLVDGQWHIDVDFCNQ